MYDPLFTDFFASVFSWVFTAFVVGIILVSVMSSTRATRIPRRSGPTPAGPQPPEFDWQHFYGHVAQMFIASRHALADGEPAPVRPFLDDKAEAQLQRVIDECATAGVRLRHDALNVDDMQAVLVEHEPTLDRIRVLIHASSVLKASRLPAAGPSSHVDLSRFGDGFTRRAIAEYWTLVRQAGCDDSADVTPLSACPHCGAPLREQDRTVCGYCGCALVDPEHPWDSWTVQAIFPG